MEPILFLNDARGVYIPRDFATEVRRDCVKDVTAEEWAVLEAGPDHELYWDVWNDVERKASVTDPITGQVYGLYQRGDLWLVPENYHETNPDFFED
jgi:hypothetical protein